MSQAFKAAIQQGYKVRLSNLYHLCKSAHWFSLRSWSWEISITLSSPHSMVLASFFHHCNWGIAFNIAVAQFFPSSGNILLWVAHEFNICFPLRKGILHETTSLYLFKSKLLQDSSQLLHSLVDAHHLSGVHFCMVIG